MGSRPIPAHRTVVSFYVRFLFDSSRLLQMKNLLAGYAEWKVSEKNSWFATTWQGSHLGSQYKGIFSQRSYMKEEFSSQRREMFCSWSPTWLASHAGVFRGARLSSGGMKNELPLGAPGRLQHGRLDVTCKPAIFAIWIVFQVQTQRHWISKQTPCQMVKKSHSQWPLLPATGRTICIVCFALFWLHRAQIQVK